MTTNAQTTAVAALEDVVETRPQPDGSVNVLCDGTAWIVAVDGTTVEACPDCWAPVEYVDDAYRHVDPEKSCFLYAARPSVRWTLVIDVDPDLSPSDVIERLEGGGVRSVEWHGEDLTTR